MGESWVEHKADRHEWMADVYDRGDGTVVAIVHTDDGHREREEFKDAVVARMWAGERVAEHRAQEARRRHWHLGGDA